MADTQIKTTDPLLAFPGYLMRRASIAALSDLNEQLSELDLRHTESSVLHLIRANPGIRQSDAGKALAIKRANMAPLIARLEKRGLVVRTPIDGRSQAIDLTRDGKELAKKAMAVVESCEQGLLDKVPAELRASVIPVLLALWKGADVSSNDATNNAT